MTANAAKAPDADAATASSSSSSSSSSGGVHEDYAAAKRLAAVILANGFDVLINYPLWITAKRL